MKEKKISNKISFAIFSILLVFVLTSYSFAATYYVDASCGSSGNGTQPVCGTNGPWKTLSEAASGVPSGNHTISVAAGAYSGFTDSKNGTDVDHPRHWLASGTVTISCGGATFGVTLNGNYIKFDGFTVTNAVNGIETYDSSKSSNDYGPTGVVITNCKVNTTTDTCIEIYGRDNYVTDCDLELGSGGEDFFRVYGSGHTFRGNYIHNITGSSSDHTDVWQTMQNGNNHAAQNILIERNHVFMGSDADGKLTGESGQTSNRGSITVFMWEDASDRHASGLTIRNNIFEALGWFNSDLGRPDGLRIYNNLWRSNDNIASGHSSEIVIATSTGGADDIIIRNNMFIDKAVGVEYASGCTNKVNSNNLFWRSDGGSTSNVNYSSTGDKVNVNPLFTSYSRPVYNVTSGYKLQSGSPVIDAGTTISSMKNDYDGISRPQGAGYDLGAYEYTSIAMPPAPPRGLKVIP